MAPVITKVNQINTFDKERLIDKIYKGDDENKNV